VKFVRYPQSQNFEYSTKNKTNNKPKDAHINTLVGVIEHRSLSPALLPSGAVSSGPLMDSA